MALLSVKEGYFCLSDSKVKFQPVGLEKQSRENHIAPPLELEVFEDTRIDPVTCVREYVNRTRSLRLSEQLFVTVTQPHKAAAKATIAA